MHEPTRLCRDGALQRLADLSPRFAYRHLGAPQQLTPGEKLWILLENLLQERNCVTEIAQLDRCDCLQPEGPQRFAQFLLGFDCHVRRIAYHKKDLMRQRAMVIRAGGIKLSKRACAFSIAGWMVTQCRLS